MLSSSSVIKRLSARFSGLFKLASIKKGLLSFVMTLAVLFIVKEQVHIVKNHTDSMPERYFIHLLKVTPELGEITIVYNDYYQGNLIKKIIGVEGDEIRIDSEGTVYVNQQYVGKVCDHTSDGRRLNAIRAGVIPKGHVFLYAPHERSFDSRYEEVGLVSITQLKGRLIPLKAVK